MFQDLSPVAADIGRLPSQRSEPGDQAPDGPAFAKVLLSARAESDAARQPRAEGSTRQGGESEQGAAEGDSPGEDLAGSDSPPGSEDRPALPPGGHARAPDVPQGSDGFLEEEPAISPRDAERAGVPAVAVAVAEAEMRVSGRMDARISKPNSFPDPWAGRTKRVGAARPTAGAFAMDFASQTATERISMQVPGVSSPADRLSFASAALDSNATDTRADHSLAHFGVGLQQATASSLPGTGRTSSAGLSARIEKDPKPLLRPRTAERDGPLRQRFPGGNEFRLGDPLSWKSVEASTAPGPLPYALRSRQVTTQGGAQIRADLPADLARTSVPDGSLPAVREPRSGPLQREGDKRPLPALLSRLQPEPGAQPITLRTPIRAGFDTAATVAPAGPADPLPPVDRIAPVSGSDIRPASAAITTPQSLVPMRMWQPQDAMSAPQSTVAIFEGQNRPGTLQAAAEVPLSSRSNMSFRNVAGNATSRDTLPGSHSASAIADDQDRGWEALPSATVEARTSLAGATTSQRADGSPTHAASVVQQIIEIATNARDRAIELRLSPEELGKVRIQISTGEHGLTLHINAERPETLDLMRRNIEQLQRDLTAMGYDNPKFSFGQQQRGQDDPGSGGTRPDATARTEMPDTSAPLPQARSTGLDLRL